MYKESVFVVLVEIFLVDFWEGYNVLVLLFEILDSIILNLVNNGRKEILSEK